MLQRVQGEVSRCRGTPCPRALSPGPTVYSMMLQRVQGVGVHPALELSHQVLQYIPWCCREFKVSGYTLPSSSLTRSYSIFHDVAESSRCRGTPCPRALSPGPTVYSMMLQRVQGEVSRCRGTPCPRALSPGRTVCCNNSEWRVDGQPPCT